MTAGASFLHRTDVNVRYDMTGLDFVFPTSIFENSLDIEPVQCPQDQVENVRFEGVEENVCVRFWLDLLRDEDKNKELQLKLKNAEGF